MTDVPDTGLVEAFRPLKTGGAGSQERPTCANCPCGTKDMPGSGGNLLCNRYPPEMNMMVKQVMGAIQQIPQVGFKPVHPSMVCWEHPVLQARMRRAVEFAEMRARGMRAGTGDSDVNPLDPEAVERARKAVERARGVSVLRTGTVDSDRFPMTEPAAVQEADGRKPGDET